MCQGGCRTGRNLTFCISHFSQHRPYSTKSNLLILSTALLSFNILIWASIVVHDCLVRDVQIFLSKRFLKPGVLAGGGTSNGHGSGGASGLIANLTAEQRSIVLADVNPGEVLTVLAFAGTGKTTCLRAYAQARPHLRVLYLTVSFLLLL